MSFSPLNKKDCTGIRPGPPRTPGQSAKATISSEVADQDKWRITSKKETVKAWPYIINGTVHWKEAA